MGRGIRKIYFAVAAFIVMTGMLIGMARYQIPVQAQESEGEEQGNSEEQATDWMEGHIHQSEDKCWYYVSMNYIMNDVDDDGDVVIVGRSRDENVSFSFDTYEVFDEVGGEIDEKTRFTIPSEIDGHPVTGIGNPCQNGYYNPSNPEENALIDERRFAFNNFDDFDLVVVPEGVEMIFGFCFYASGFRAISLPSTLTYIGENAFFFDEQLETVNIPKAVEYIGPRAFRQTPWLNSMRENSSQHLVIVNGILIDGIAAEGDVVIPQSVTKIGPWAFYGTATGWDDAPSKITSVDIPDTVKEIGDYAFASCIYLNKVVIGIGLEKTGYLAFARSSVCEITLPNSLTDIGMGLCYECKSLQKVSVGNQVKELGNSLFARCNSLETVTLPSGLEIIGYTCFYECTSLTDISIPKSVTVIDSGAFEKCSKLSKVILPESLQILGEDAFLVNSDSSGNKVVLTIPETMTDISELELLDLDYVTLRVLAGSSVEKYLNDNEVSSYQTFMKGMQDVNESAVNITNNNTTNNETTIIDNSTTIVDNSTTNNTTLVDNSVTNNITDNYTIDSSTNIDNSVTNNNTDNSVDITNNIENSNIENLVNNVNNENNVINNDNSGKSENDVAVGKVFVFKKMKYQINADEKTVTFVCAENKKMTSLTIPKTVTCNKKSFRVTDIAKNACKGMKNLKTVTIGADVETVGEKAFYNCEKLKTVTFGKNVEEIGKLAFYGDKSIKNINFKKIKNLKSVGKAAFYLRSKKTDINLKAKQTSKKKMIKYLYNSGVSLTY